MIGVTIGVARYGMLARQAAAAFSEKTGLQVYILGDDEFASSGLSMPHYLKFRIFDLVPDDEDIVFFDSDMVCLNAWEPPAHRDPRAIVAVRDRILPLVQADAETWSIPIEEYFNSGLFIMNRRWHREWLRRAEALHLSQPLTTTYFYDQTPLNAAQRQFRNPDSLSRP